MNCERYLPQKHRNCHAELSCFPTAPADPFGGQVTMVVKILLLEISTEALCEATWISVAPRDEVKPCGNVLPCDPPLLFLYMLSAEGEV